MVNGFHLPVFEPLLEPEEEHREALSERVSSEVLDGEVLPDFEFPQSLSLVNREIDLLRLGRRDENNQRSKVQDLGDGREV